MLHDSLLFKRELINNERINGGIDVSSHKWILKIMHII